MIINHRKTSRSSPRLIGWQPEQLALVICCLKLIPCFTSKIVGNKNLIFFPEIPAKRTMRAEVKHGIDFNLRKVWAWFCILHFVDKQYRLKVAKGRLCLFMALIKQSFITPSYLIQKKALGSKPTWVWKISQKYWGKIRGISCSISLIHWSLLHINEEIIFIDKDNQPL